MLVYYLTIVQCATLVYITAYTYLHKKHRIFLPGVLVILHC